MPAYEIIIVVILSVIFILLSLLPFINHGDDSGEADPLELGPDVPPAWMPLHRR